MNFWNQFFLSEIKMPSILKNRHKVWIYFSILNFLLDKSLSRPLLGLDLEMVDQLTSGLKGDGKLGLVCLYFLFKRIFVFFYQAIIISNFNFLIIIF